MTSPAPSPAERIVGLYESHAVAFDAQRSRNLMERRWLDRFVALMPPSGSVLDIGCGMGEPIAACLIALRHRVTGIDSSATLIELCRRRFPDAMWHRADMRALALGRRFDGLIAWDSFFHLTPPDQRAMFGIFTAHAGPRATLMFTSGPAAGEAIGHWQGEPLYHASLDPVEYRRLLDRAGFDVVDFVPEDPDCGRHTIWLAQAR